MEKSIAELEGITQPPSPTQAKQPAAPAPPAVAPLPLRRRASIASYTFIAAFLCLVIFVVSTRPRSLTGPHVSPYFPGWAGRPQPETEHDGQEDEAGVVSTEVPFEAHIMSKCPDAQACLHKLVLPAMEQIHDKVDFRLSFIGNASSDSDAVSCMHGPGECVGNMLILCAANLPFPYQSSSSSALSTSAKTPPIRSLGFAHCLLSQYEQVPSRSLSQSCAAEHGIDFTALNRCVSRGLTLGPGDLVANDDDVNDEQEIDTADDDDDDEDDKPNGLTLLRNSFERSKSVGATKSCTVRVDEKTWCIHDGGEWAECGDDARRAEVWTLVDEIERLWHERN